MSKVGGKYHGSTLLGFYSTFDGLIYLDEPIESLHDLMGARVANHELMHYFQNFFTPAGLSHFFIIILINRCLGDLLEDCPPIVEAPLLQWLPETEYLGHGSRSLKSYDRAIRMLTQLETATGSSAAARALAHRPDLGRITGGISNGRMTLDPENTCLTLEGEPLLPVDYQAICESMALAQEIQHAAAFIVRRDTAEGKGLTISQPSTLQGLIHDLGEKAVRDPRNLQYSFPLLLLRHVGYSYVEALLITAVISFLSLFRHFILPGTPEFGSDRMTKFGSRISRVYVQLLIAALRDSFLHILNLAPDPTLSTAAYLDMYTTAADMPKFSGSLAELLTLLRGLEESFGPDDWLSQYARQQFRNARRLAERLLEMPMIQGLSIIVNPQHYLLDTGILPIGVNPEVIRSGRFINFGNMSQDTFDEMALRILGLHVAKCVLLGPDEIFQKLREHEGYVRALYSFLAAHSGVHVNGWPEPSDEMLARWKHKTSLS